MKLIDVIACCGAYFVTELPEGGLFTYSNDCYYNYRNAVDELYYFDNFPKDYSTSSDLVANAILYGISGFEQMSIKEIAYRSNEGVWYVGNDALPLLYGVLELF